MMQRNIMRKHLLLEFILEICRSKFLLHIKKAPDSIINSTMNNPSYIRSRSFKKIIYGCESWWKTIRSVDEFSKISNEDINNTWYVKLLQSMDQPEEE